MSDKAKPEMFNNNLDENDEQNVTHSPNTDLTETVGVQTMKNGTEEQDETQPPKNEMDETIGPKKKKDGKDEQNTTHPPNIKTTERTEFETMKDGKDEHTTNHPLNIAKTETTGFETLKDGVQCSMSDIESPSTENKKSQDDCEQLQRKEDKNAIHHPDIDMTETIGFETVEDGEEEQNATHPPNILRTETVEFQTMKDGIQCSMFDIESSNTVNKKPQDVCEKLQRTQAKLKNKNKKLRRSVNDMDRTLSQEKNLVSHLQEREKNLVSEIENANAMNKQLRGNCEMLQSTNNKIVKENKMLQKSVQDKDQSLSREMKTVSDLQKSTNKTLLKENTMLLKSVQDKDQSLSNERKTVSDLQKRVESLILDLESTNAVNKQLHTENETLQNMYYNNQRKNEQLEKSLKDMNRALSQEKETVSDLQKRMQNQVQTYQQREARLKAAYDDEVLKSGIQKKQICDLQVQRDDSLNRLSKLAGDMLTHENTNITDLSDASRPTKLSETYSELYDNEWTDAFEELTGRDLTDIRAVGKLLDMLLLSFRKCREVTWERYQSLKSTVSTIDIVHVLPSMRELTEFEEKIKTTSTESERSSHNEKYNIISINSEAQNIDSDAKEVVDTSEQMELEHQREQHGEHGTEMVNYPDNCATNGCRETEILCNQNKEGEFTPHTKEKHLTCTTTLTVDQEREIKRIWRTATTALMDEAVRHLHIVLLAKFDISIEHWPNTSKYLAKCIELCWKMGVQEKPMHLDACNEKGDGCEKIFNQAKFRAYTKTGKRVAFVVWPALFIHEGGAMLVKGIAQGCQ